MLPTIATTLSNPGIIDRLERDIGDYLAPFGFRLDRVVPPTRKGGAEGTNDDASDGGGTAVLATPRLPYSYAGTAGTRGTSKRSIDENESLAVVEADAAGPVATLHLHVYREALLPSAGPLLRTFLRLSCRRVSPLRLRAVIHCDFTLDALEKFDRMSSEQKRRQLTRQEESNARRIAHDIHLLVRNSMGSALCLELVVVLPCYWRRKSCQGGSFAADAATVGFEVPISAASVSRATRDNRDACYPSVQLVQRTLDSESPCENDDDVSPSRSIHLDVRTRMCTVRHQPLLFQWLHAVQCSSERNAESPRHHEELPSIDVHLRRRRKFQTMPLIGACIEKVANLHRILMLCNDYDKIQSGKDKHEEAENGNEELLIQSLLSNVIVILPNDGNENHERGKTWRAFENAVDHFHEAITKPESDTASTDADRGRGGGQDRLPQYRPTFVYEAHAVEVILGMIKQRHRSDSDDSKAALELSMVGIDLHPDALTLLGDYVDSNERISTALQTLRNADVLLFGYESTGRGNIHFPTSSVPT